MIVTQLSWTGTQKYSMQAPRAMLLRTKRDAELAQILCGLLLLLAGDVTEQSSLLVFGPRVI